MTYKVVLSYVPSAKQQCLVNVELLATEIAAPALVNAIANATGRRLGEIPATLERVLLGHKLSRKGPRGSLHEESIAGDACQLGRGQP